MKIENLALIEEYRRPGPCAVCGQHARVREAHHLRRKGFGGGAVLDVRINLIALGGSVKIPKGGRRLSCDCHRLVHDGHVSAERILSLVAQRERVADADITEVLDWMERIIKPTDAQLVRALTQLSDSALSLAVRELREAGRLVEL